MRYPRYKLISLRFETAIETQDILAKILSFLPNHHKNLLGKCSKNCRNETLAVMIDVFFMRQLGTMPQSSALIKLLESRHEDRVFRARLKGHSSVMSVKFGLLSILSGRSIAWFQPDLLPTLEQSLGLKGVELMVYLMAIDRRLVGSYLNYILYRSPREQTMPILMETISTIRPIIANPRAEDAKILPVMDMLDVITNMVTNYRPSLLTDGIFRQDTPIEQIYIRGLFLGSQYPPLRHYWKSDPFGNMVGVYQNGKRLQSISLEFRDNRAIVLAAVRQNAWALQFASDNMKNDWTIVNAAIRQNAWALKFASNRIKNDRSTVLTAVGKDGWVLKFAAPALTEDPIIVLAAVRQNGRALQFASDILKDNWEIVMAAINQNGTALEFASEALKNRFSSVWAAVHKNEYAIRFASAAIRSNQDFLYALIDQGICGPTILKYAHPSIRHNRDFIWAAVHLIPLAIKYAAPSLKSDKDFLLQLINGGVDGHIILSYASPILHEDSDIVFAVICQNGLALAHLLPKFKSNFFAVFAAVRQNGYALKFAAPNLKSDPIIAHAAVCQNGWAFQFTSTRMQHDWTIARAAVHQNRDVIQIVPPILLKNPDFIEYLITDGISMDDIREHTSPSLPVTPGQFSNIHG